MFASEKTLNLLGNEGFQNSFAGLPLSLRVTHPANHGYPDATFDYLFGKNLELGKRSLRQLKFRIIGQLHVNSGFSNLERAA